MTDIAVAQMHQLVRARDFRACAYWLSSRMGRERGFNPPMSEPVNGDQPRVTGFILKFVTPESLKAERAGKVIEHEALEDTRTEADL